MESFRMPLSKGNEAIVTFKYRPLHKKDIEKIREYLDIFEETLVVQDEDEDVDIDMEKLLKNFANMDNRKAVYEYAMKRSEEILAGINPETDFD